MALNTQLTYAHCIDDTLKMGYELRTVEFELYRVNHGPDGFSFECHVDGQAVGYGYSDLCEDQKTADDAGKKEAIDDAIYKLMDASRTAFYAQTN